MPDGQYVEVKAWLDEQGRAKLAACPGVNVLMKKEMEPFILYAMEKYGRNFIRLYEKKEKCDNGSRSASKADGGNTLAGSNPVFSAR